MVQMSNIGTAARSEKGKCPGMTDRDHKFDFYPFLATIIAQKVSQGFICKVAY